MNNYKPTRKDIVKEMCKGLEIKNETYKTFKKNAGDILKGTIGASILLYALPSIKITNDEHKKDFHGLMNSTELLNFIDIGNLIGLGGWYLQYRGYKELIEQGYPAWILPVATNVMSGIYELKGYYDNTKNKLIENHKGLEDKVESTKISNETSDGMGGN